MAKQHSHFSKAVSTALPERGGGQLEAVLPSYMKRTKFRIFYQVKPDGNIFMNLLIEVLNPR